MSHSKSATQREVNKYLNSFISNGYHQKANTNITFTCKVVKTSNGTSYDFEKVSLRSVSSEERKKNRSYSK